MASSAPVVPAPVPRRVEGPSPLSPGEVHLWFADLDERVADDSLLDGAERHRAAAMIPRVHRRFVASRDLLRRILGTYADTDPSALRFETVGEGKPRLVPFTADAPRFNLSHAGGRWLLAVSTCEVGVDVERTDRHVDMERVGRRLLRAEELAAVLAVTGEDRRRVFFRAWTGREALVKARAEGMFTLSLPAAMVLDPALPLALAARSSAGWSLCEVPMESPWTAALASERVPARIESFRVA